MHLEDAQPGSPGRPRAERKHLLTQGEQIIRDDQEQLVVLHWVTIDTWRRLSPTGQLYELIDSRPREATS